MRVKGFKIFSVVVLGIGLAGQLYGQGWQGPRVLLKPAQTPQGSRPVCGTPLVEAQDEAIENNTRQLRPELPQTLLKSPLQTGAAYEVGDTLRFFVTDFVNYTYYSKEAVCREKSARTYLFVGTAEWDSGWVAANDVVGFMQAFEERTPVTSVDPNRGIRDIDESYFGLPPNKSGDGYVYILVYDIRDEYDPDAGQNVYVQGYFSPRDQGNSAYSNRKDLIYIDCRPGDSSSFFTLGAVAHEYQHLIHYGMDPDEDYNHDGLWVNEGCSEYAEYLCGYGLRSPTQFLEHPDRSLTFWNYYGDDVLIDYAKVALWTYYLGEHFGPELITRIVADRSQGVEGVRSALASFGVSLSFEAIFANWATANLLDDPDLGGNGYYGYAALDLPVLPEMNQTHRYYPVDTRSGFLEEWAVDYVCFSGVDTTAVLDFDDESVSPIQLRKVGRGETPGVEDVVLDVNGEGTVALDEIGGEYESVVLIPISRADNSRYAYSVTSALRDMIPPRITSGPRESVPTSWSITVFWETDELADGVVEYGTSLSYGSTVVEGSYDVSHSVTLSGLSPGTTYHYRVGSTDVRGNGPTYSADFWFETSYSQPGAVTAVWQSHSAAYNARNVVRDAEGRIHLVWHELLGSRRFIYQACSDDDGQTWSSPVRVDSTLFYGGMPSLAVDSQDRLHVVWHAQVSSLDEPFGIYYSWSGDGGEQWSDAVCVGSPASNGFLYGSVIVDASDNPHVVWNSALYADQYRGEVYHNHSIDGGITWVGQRMISGSSDLLCFAPTLAFDSMGAAHVVYSDGDFNTQQRNVYYTSSSDFVEWEPAVAVSRSGVLYDGIVSFVVDGEDGLHVVWADNYTPGDIRVMYATWTREGGVWSEPMSVVRGSTGGEVSYPSLGVDDSGYLYLVYRDDLGVGGLGKPLFREMNEENGLCLRKELVSEMGDVFVTWNKGGEWAIPSNISNDATNSVYPELASSVVEEAPDIIWVSSVGTETNEIMYIRFETSGTQDEMPPHVVSVSPSAGAVDVPSSRRVTQIAVVFDERVLSDSLNLSNVVVANEEELSGEVTYDESLRQLMFTPDEDLPVSSGITVTLRGRIVDLVGNPLDGDGDGVGEGSPDDDYVWSFTTAGPDVVPPTFTIGVLQNPVLTRYVDLYVVPSEYLITVPTMTVGGENVALEEINRDVHVYKGDYRLETGGVLSIQVVGEDVVGNRGEGNKAFSAELFKSDVGGEILSVDGKCRLRVFAGALGSDTFLTIVGETAGALTGDSAEMLPRHSLDVGGETSGLAYTIGPAGLDLSRRALLEFVVPQGEVGLNRIGVFSYEVGEWQEIPSRLTDAGTLEAEIVTLGKYCLGYRDGQVPERFTLLQNYPNPFNRTTTIAYELPVWSRVRLVVYNVQGRTVRVLEDVTKGPGIHEVVWDGRDGGGVLVSGGVYFYRVETETWAAAKKLVVLP